MKKYLSYLPLIFSEINEFRALAEVIDSFIAEAYEKLALAEKGVFIDSATGEWLSRHEDFYSIPTKKGEGDEERRFRIMTVINGELPYTMKNLKQKLRLLAGENNFEIECDAVNSTLTVTVGIEAQNSYNQVAEMLRRIVPANMALTVIQQFKTYSEVSALERTYSGMNVGTHEDYRRGKQA